MSKPTNPSEISFDPRCFAQDGVRVEWVVTRRAPFTPARFRTEQEAVEFAKKSGRTVRRVETPIMRRIAWTLAEVA